MKTIDVSGLTLDDLERAGNEIKRLGLDGNYGQVTGTLSAYATVAERWTLGLYIYGAQNNKIHLNIHHSDIRGKFICCLAYNDEHGLLPVNFSDLLISEYVSSGIRNLKKHAPAFQAGYDKIIRTLRTQSKEDFYDDASDYQDDEPTDFGDASNYDENLVRRIRRLID